MQRAVVMMMLVLSAGAGFGAELDLSLWDAKLNEQPKGFRSALGGGASGKAGEWRMLFDEVPSVLAPVTPRALPTKRMVLGQLSQDPTDERYLMLIYEGETFTDFKLSTRFKIVSGQTEQMAGIAFRIKDEKNYYYIRASALGQNLYFWKCVGGQLFGPFGAKLQIPTNTWQELTIECRGNEIRCGYNGKEAFAPITDTSLGSGKIGFWTKSDSVSYFTDTKITYVRRDPLAQLMVQETLQKYPRLKGLKIYIPNTNQPTTRIIGSTDPKDLGQIANSIEHDVITNGRTYTNKEKGSMQVTMPLRDVNGEPVAAARVIMNSFAEQSEKNAIARALPIVRFMETKFHRAGELTQ